jgi:hypothetical protein
MARPIWSRCCQWALIVTGLQPAFSRLCGQWRGSGREAARRPMRGFGASRRAMARARARMSALPRVRCPRGRRGRRFWKTGQRSHRGLGHRSPRSLHRRPFHRRARVVVRHAAPAGLGPAPVGLAIGRQARIPGLPAFPAIHLCTPDAVVPISAVEARGRVKSPAGRHRLRIIFCRHLVRHAGRLDGGGLASRGGFYGAFCARRVELGGGSAADE